jgi:RNA ligase-like protein
MIPFPPMPKIARLSRDMIVTEKIDGTNASIFIGEDGTIQAGSRTRWITPENDNFGFAKWVQANADCLRALGPGHHFGEWWGLGIQRGYGLTGKHFSLFNVSRWRDAVLPTCVSLVPILYEGPFDTGMVDGQLDDLRVTGSLAAPGWMQPEGVVIYHVQGNVLFKKTLDKNDGAKGEA